MNFWYFYSVIIFFETIRSQDVSQSLVVLSTTGIKYVPIEPTAQLISSSIFNSMEECFDACNANSLCRIFDYGAVVTKQCRLFEGDTTSLGNLVSSSMPDSIVGTIQLTPSLFTEYGHSCSTSCNEYRYLTCISNQTCQCLPHTYWNPLNGMCLAQSPILGDTCQQNMNMCREDLNYTCLQFDQCGPISVLSGTTIADSNTVIVGTPTTNINFPYGLTMYEVDGESLIVADYGTEQILYLSNVNSNNINVSVLIPRSWIGGDNFYFPFDIFLDVQHGYNLYVTDSGNNRLLMFYSMQATVTPLKVIDGLPTYLSPTNNILNGPFGIKRDNYENLMVADVYNHRVIRWALNATSAVVIAGTGSSGDSSMELSYPTGLFLDNYRSLLYVTDTNNHRIQLFNLTGPIPYSGTTVAGGNGQGTGSHQLNSPLGIWVSNKTETIYIVDTDNNRIQRWSKGARAGVTIAGDPNGTPGTDATKLQSPSGIAVNNAETRMYITDTKNNRIQLFHLI